MAKPSQSQDVEHQGGKPRPQDDESRQERDRKAQSGSRQKEQEDSQLSQRGTNTPSRPD